MSMACTAVHTIPCPLPTTTAHLPWAGVEGAGCAPRLHKSHTGGQSLLQVVPPLQGPSRGLVDIRSDQQGSSTALSDQLFLNREGHPLPAPCPRG